MGLSWLSQEPERARRSLRCIELAPNLYFSHIVRALALYCSGEEYEEAFAHLDTAIALNNKDFLSYWLKGGLLRGCSRYAEAEEPLRRAHDLTVQQELREAEAMVRTGLGTVFLLQKKEEEAERAAREEAGDDSKEEEVPQDRQYIKIEPVSDPVWGKEVSKLKKGEQVYCIVVDESIKTRLLLEPRCTMRGLLDVALAQYPRHPRTL